MFDAESALQAMLSTGLLIGMMIYGVPAAIAAWNLFQ